MKLILDYINDPSKSESEGWQLLLALGLMLLSRLAFFTMNFNVGLQTAIRLSGATQYIGFSKLLRLSNPSDKALGQLVTCCTSDQERIAEAVIISVLFFGKLYQKLMRLMNYVLCACSGTPIMFVLSTIYSWMLVGPMCLLGLLIVLLLYPIMVSICISILISESCEYLINFFLGRCSYFNGTFQKKSRRPY